MPVTEVDRDFYEAKWASTDFSRGSLRNWLVRKERFFVSQLAGKRGRVLDLGCGGGWSLYTTVGSAFGVDLSAASCRAAARVYRGAAVAELAALPFPADTFELVVSSDVLGHVPPADKGDVWSEIARVLKPGGFTVHYIEADGDDPLMRFAKRYPDLYQTRIVSLEGHVGLETVDRICERFRRLGLVPLQEKPAYRGLTYIGRFVQYFDNEYSAHSKGLRLLVTCFKGLIRAGLELPANLVASLLIEMGDRALPRGWAGGLLVAYQKPQGK